MAVHPGAYSLCQSGGSGLPVRERRDRQRSAAFGGRAERLVGDDGLADEPTDGPNCRIQDPIRTDGHIRDGGEAKGVWETLAVSRDGVGPADRAVGGDREWDDGGGLGAR